jgi:ferrochelatase
LFYDKEIIKLPNPLRWIIAHIISISRCNKSKKLYSYIGNKSPLLQETEAQKQALTIKLKDILKYKFEIFISMRHFYPMARDIVKKIDEYNPSEIILLPLYPQFSNATTGSSIRNFIDEYKKKNIKIKAICCYRTNKYFIKAHVSLIKQALKQLKDKENFRILFSAHNLPKSFIEAGDPYQFQIEQSVNYIINELKINNLDYMITYQSKVGAVEWLKPNSEDEIKEACDKIKSLIIVPISFVSEHVETLVELDITYRAIVGNNPIQYIRIETLRINEYFIESLSEVIVHSINHNGCDENFSWISMEECSKIHNNCPIYCPCK